MVRATDRKQDTNECKAECENTTKRQAIKATTTGTNMGAVLYRRIRLMRADSAIISAPGCDTGGVSDDTNRSTTPLLAHR